MTLVIPAEGAKVLIVKFNDYQCPPCRQSYMDYKPIFAKYSARRIPASVRLVMKDFPLEAECNNNVADERCIRPAAKRRSRCVWRASTTAARRSRSGSSPTSRR